MKIATDFNEDVCILTLSGELDSRGNLQLDNTLKTLAQAGNYKVVMDVTTIRFVGNQTISILLKNLKEFRAGGGNIMILNPQRSVLQYLKSNRMFEFLDIFSSKSEAVKALKQALPKPKSSATSQPASQESKTTQPEAQSTGTLENRFATGEILYANSCMLATLIKTLEQKGILSSEEALDLMDTEQLPSKGETE